MQPIDERNIEPGQRVRYRPEEGPLVGGQFDTSIEGFVPFYRRDTDDRGWVQSRLFVVVVKGEMRLARPEELWIEAPTEDMVSQQG